MCYKRLVTLTKYTTGIMVTLTKYIATFAHVPYVTAAGAIFGGQKRQSIEAAERGARVFIVRHLLSFRAICGDTYEQCGVPWLTISCTRYVSHTHTPARRMICGGGGWAGSGSWDRGVATRDRGVVIRDRVDFCVW